MAAPLFCPSSDLLPHRASSVRAGLVSEWDAHDAMNRSLHTFAEPLHLLDGSGQRGAENKGLNNAAPFECSLYFLFLVAQ